MIQILAAVFLGLVILPLSGWTMGTREQAPPLETAPKVNLTRYMGTWYEIASFPHSFQKGCMATKASYVLKDDGNVAVTNECRRGSLDGELTTARGTAKVADAETNAKLKVTFFWPFYGDYWIIDLGREYEYAVVGHPSREYLWVLARSPRMDDGVYSGILDRLNRQGYDTSRLVRTVQPQE
jgi:apolipoprotein D and lipocalin family protein